VLGTKGAGRAEFCGEAVDGADRLESAVEDGLLERAEQGAGGGRPRQLWVVPRGERRRRRFDVRGGGAAVLVGARGTRQRLAVEQSTETQERLTCEQETLVKIFYLLMA